MHLIIAYIISWSLGKDDEPLFLAITLALVLFFIFSHYHSLDACHAKTCFDNKKAPAMIEDQCVCLEAPK